MFQPAICAGFAWDSVHFPHSTQYGNMFWICAGKSMDDTGMFPSLLSSALAEPRPFLLLTRPCQRGGWGGTRSWQRTQPGGWLNISLTAGRGERIPCFACARSFCFTCPTAFISAQELSDFYSSGSSPTQRQGLSERLRRAQLLGGAKPGTAQTELKVLQLLNNSYIESPQCGFLHNYFFGSFACMCLNNSNFSTGALH